MKYEYASGLLARFGIMPEPLAKYLARRQVFKRMRVPPPVFDYRSLPYVANERLHAGIASVLHLPGVHVLFSEPGTGKTTAAHMVLGSLISAGKCPGALLMNGREVRNDSDIHIQSWLGQSQGLVIPGRMRLSELFPACVNKDPFTSPPIPVVLMDQFEQLLSVNPVSYGRVQNMLRDVAHDSRENKNFSVLVMVKDRSLFEDIITWNGHDKIAGVFRDDSLARNSVPFAWTEPELVAVIDGWVAAYPHLESRKKRALGAITGGAFKSIPHIGDLLLAS
jgi:hypothetical protein